MGNNQKIVFKFSKINTRIKLIALWISLIILYYCTSMFDSFLVLITFSPVAEKINHNINLKFQEVIHQLIMDHIHGKEWDRTKLLAADILRFLSNSPNTYFLAELIIKLIPVLLIIANIFIKKNAINYINIIAGFFYIISGISILFYNFYNIPSIIIFAGALISTLIIITSIQWLKIKEEDKMPEYAIGEKAV